jgi:hypothetical protein
MPSSVSLGLGNMSQIFISEVHLVDEGGEDRYIIIMEMCEKEL